MNDGYLVGIDEGTTGVKVCVYDLNGNCIGKSYKEYKSYFPKNGYVEQDIGEIEESLYETCREAITTSNIDNKKILAVSISSQGSACILLDENNRLLRKRMIGWQDLRNIEFEKEIRRKITDDEHYKIAGSIVGSHNVAVNLWVKKNEPNIWKNVKHICTNQDYFLHILGSEGFFTDISSAHCVSLIEVDNNTWSKKLCDIYEMEEDKLPCIVSEAGKVVGSINKEVSKKTGLPIGCKICVGAQDTNCSSFGSGGIDNKTAVMVVGTLGSCYIAIDKPLKDKNKVIVLKGNQGLNNYQLETYTFTAGSALRWFRDTFCKEEIELGNKLKRNPYEIIIENAQKSTIGANGVIALTCMNGTHARRNNAMMKGTFFGVSLNTTKIDISRAILEGICFEMKDLLLLEEEFSGNVEKVRLSVGITKSKVWCQMLADILDKKIEILESEENATLGAAMYAGVGIGAYKNCKDAVNKCVRIKETYFPNKKSSMKYSKVFDLWNKAFDLVDKKYY